MWFTDPLYLVFLATGFTVGFGHCVGMCGPIVVSFTLHMQTENSFLSHLLYNGGRITTYAVLGGAMGVTGQFTQVVGGIAHIQKFMVVFAGLVVLVMGLAMGGWIPSGRIFKEENALWGFVSKRFKGLAGSKTPRTYRTYFPLGLLLGLLPCGPVYTALIAAARFGMEAPGSMEGFVKGSLLMLAFGVGTVPALLAVAKLARFGWLRWRRRIYQFSAVVMVGVGVYFVVKGIRY